MIENTCIQCKKHFRSKQKKIFCDACKNKHKALKMGIIGLAPVATLILSGVKQAKKLQK